VALLIVPTRLLSLVAGTTALFTAGTLAGLFLSLHVSLFGFREFPGAPYETESIILESVGIGLSILLCAAYARATLAWRRQARGKPTAI